MALPNYTPKNAEYAPFALNSYYEHLLEIRRTRPDVFAAFSPAQRLTLGYYEAAKRERAMIAGNAAK